VLSDHELKTHTIENDCQAESIVAVFELDLRTGVIQHVLSNRTRLPKYTEQMCHYTTLQVSHSITQLQRHSKYYGVA